MYLFIALFQTTMYRSRLNGGGGTVAEHFSKWIFPSSCFSQNAVVVVAAAVVVAVVAVVALLQLVLKLDAKLDDDNVGNQRMLLKGYNFLAQPLIIFATQGPILPNVWP